MRLGIISDTHGLLRPEALAALRGSDHIVHAGDVGDPFILDRLRGIAPVTAIRGNIDRQGPCSLLPSTETFELEGRLIHVLHALGDLDLHPAVAGIHAVLYGHSHKPQIEWRENVLYLNPGSAGPRRFSLPITVGLLELTRNALHPQIVPLEPL